ncbi:gastrula zinc finger protein XlCGF57.1-like isoform X2 [Rhinatrema bivittatum]|nr:gastrula zinc finger protein XlCGF57.1-like isoform X2 [Rhinatrema bivittatum]
MKENYQTLISLEYDGLWFEKERHHVKFTENLEANQMLSERDGEITSSYSDWGRDYRNQCVLDKKQKNATVSSCKNSPMCKQRASNIKQAVKEQRNQTTEQKCLCDICGRFISDPVTLKSHQISHTEERPFTNIDIGQTFSKKGKVLEQEESTTVGGPKGGELEQEKSSPVRGPKGELLEEEKSNIGRGPKGELLEQEKSNTGEELKGELLEQEKSNTEEGPKGELLEQEKSTTGGKSFPCTENRESLIRDYIKFNPQNFHFSCTECGKNFLCKAGLRRHQKIHSMGKKPFTRAKRDKNFNQKINLIEQKIHTNETFSCTVCGKSFRHKISLRRHKKMHKEETKLVPNIPWLKSKVHSFQAMHKTNPTGGTILGERPFPCAECEKRFFCRINLVCHQMNHTAQRPFSCTERVFIQKTNLIKHHKKTGIIPNK